MFSLRSQGTRHLPPLHHPPQGRGRAAHLTDHAIPHEPVRQWVLSLPKRLRPFLSA
jgi:hypothetical protein